MRHGVVRDRGRLRRPGLIPQAEALEGRALLATFLVTGTGDAGDGTLRDAIERANLDPAADRIEFAPSVVGEIRLATALPDLSTDITLAGPGASALAVARAGGVQDPQFRIFTVTAGPQVEISGLTIANGLAVLGGGISNAGTLRLSGVILARNLASGLGTPYAEDGTYTGDGRGGGIDNAGTLTIANSLLSENRASGGASYSPLHPFAGSGSGGGIANSGTLTIIDSTLDGNSAGGGYASYFGNGRGGGIANSGTLMVIRSTISNNGASGSSGSGGGIANSGTASLINATVGLNAAAGAGSSGSGSGGGISNRGTLTVAHSTLVDNSTFGRFGIRDGATIHSFDEEARLVISSSILAGEGPAILSFQRDRVTSLGRNLFSDAPDISLDPTDLVDTDPLLGPLADNGGPTRTHALLPGSPAIDAGLASADAGTDQRGIPRPQGTAPDIGAFESRGFVVAISGGDGQSAPPGSPFALPLAVIVTSPFGEPVAGGRVNFAAPGAGASLALAASTAPIDEAGRAAIDATANGLAGAYTVAVGATGAAGVSISLTNEAGTGGPPPPDPNEPIIVPNPNEPIIGPGPIGPIIVPDPIGPVVLNLRRSGFGRRKAFLTLAFSGPLDPARASDVGNYRLVAPGRDGRFGTRDDRRIKIRSAEYDPSAATVTLRPPARLALRGRFRLTLNGSGPGGIADPAGTLLDGDRDGRPGGDHVATFREPARAGRR